MTAKYESGANLTDLENELYTPQKIIRAAKSVIGILVFDLDPASCLYANNLHEKGIALQIYNESMDGYTQPWFGNIWLSPPLGLDEAGESIPKKWFHLAQKKYSLGEIDNCFVLLKIDFQCDWFIMAQSYPHCILKSKLTFYTPTAKEKIMNDCDYMIVYL
jgi:hypothetical protein